MFDDTITENPAISSVQENFSATYSRYGNNDNVNISMMRSLGDESDIHDVLQVMADMLRAIGYTYVDKLVAVTPDGGEFVV